MTDFRENVLDIIDEWGGYQTLSCGQPALNSGHVQLKCYINNVCPFYKTPRKEDSIVFNSDTYEELKRSLPNIVTSAITTTPGVEGLHFKHRKVFRHNYINKPKTDITIAEDVVTQFKNFSNYYQDISVTGKPSVIGADKTLYKQDHDWAIIDSVFDNKSCSGGEVEECGIKAHWSYWNKDVPVNKYRERDIELDYEPGYWQAYRDSLEYDSIKEAYFVKDGEPIRIEKFNVQMPVQTRTHDENANGIHWKVVKRTPVYQGADFFVRFYKMAQDPVRYTTQLGNVPFNNDFYRPLDHTYTKTVIVDPIGNFERYANEAVRIPANVGDDVNLYDFYTQAYYIIEMEKQYFIVIPQRGFPFFVNFFKGENSNGTVAKRLGDPFTGVSGEELINAEYFDIVVRNHLGRLVIQFEGKGFNNVPPWIVQRFDWVSEKVESGETAYMVEKPRDIVVPKGHIYLWGGNIRCGFLFGHLQYEAAYTSFIYPPRAADVSDDIEVSQFAAFDEITPEELSFSTEYFNTDPLWLPLNGAGNGRRVSHHLVFESYSGEQLEQGSIGDQSTAFYNKPLFTQDAQYYKNYSDKDDADWEVGYFYYNMPQKEFSPGDSARTSAIIINKYKFLNYDRTRHQGFNTYIGMMCGDHFYNNAFHNNFWDGGGLSAVKEEVIDNLIFNNASPAPGEWFLRNCKTPILSSIRLISDASPDPRWVDGTTIANGISRDPESGSVSPYFLDASDHVMNFSHAWTASGLTSLEHSGTIQFYLNHDMDVDINITSDLIALQDKTFYIEIWAGYRHRDSMQNCDHSNYTRIPGFFKVFTGMCPGGSISYEYGKHVMTCKLEDYTVVLKGMKFFNSPWFDAMKDAVAIKEIMTMAGFRDQGVYDPGSLIAGLADNSISSNPNRFHQHFDGRVFKFESFGLPSGYNRLMQPSQMTYQLY